MQAAVFGRTFANFVEATGGTDCLRKVIIHLGITGNLVRQESNDTPVAELLQRIRGTRGDQRRTFPATFQPNVLPQLPAGWQRSCLGDVADVEMGNSPPGDSYNDSGQGIPLINGPVEFSRGPFGHTLKTKFTTSPTKLCRAGDLLICVRGSTTGRTNLAGFDACIGRGVAAIRAHIFQGFLNYCVLARRDDIFNMGTGSTFPSVSQGQLWNIAIQVPPLGEQRRITAKLDELMSVCDELESRQQQRRQVRIQLNDAALDRLVTASDPAEFASAWQRVRDNFDVLYAVPENVAKLRQAIMHLAVKGKLVPQDANDDPAATVLEQIQRDRGFGKTTPVPSPEGPFPLPRGWAWATFPALGTFGRGKSRHRPRNDRKLFRDGRFPLVQTGDVARSKGIITTYTSLYNDVGLAQSRVWPKGTMCITIAANIADSGLLIFDACIPDSVVGFIPHKVFDDARFFEYFMRTAKEKLEQYAPSTAQKNINLGILEKVQVPVPPLAEIGRIVSRVNKLMSLCDELEAKLQEQRDKADLLAQAVVNAIVNEKMTDGKQLAV